MVLAAVGTLLARAVAQLVDVALVVDHDPLVVVVGHSKVKVGEEAVVLGEGALLLGGGRRRGRGRLLLVAPAEHAVARRVVLADLPHRLEVEVVLLELEVLGLLVGVVRVRDVLPVDALLERAIGRRRAPGARGAVVAQVDEEGHRNVSE